MQLIYKLMQLIYKTWLFRTCYAKLTLCQREQGAGSREQEEEALFRKIDG
ncbi:hypothetical protein [Moorena sp. SIO3A2]|uniref:Uncharacterized protein n=1 Tax=Moorena producens 3L TaxID=489825 RepID=F4XZX7_9CYAN|nr:hypothetical protein [Moorena sp. SIO3A2]EGJ29895.1 hypothetical protein LYNGBM3L_58440 [Moorena producens 3L]NEP30850.1 hypothetical protein [Moorena sp. SIO3B2]NES43438.1 hypothetical protein [Moorena sp. SIO2C4]